MIPPNDSPPCTTGATGACSATRYRAQVRTLRRTWPARRSWSPGDARTTCRIRTVERARQPAKRPGGGSGSSANGAPRSGPYFPFRAYVGITWENWDPYRQGQPSRTVDRAISASFATPADLAKESYPVGKGGKVAGEPSESTLMTGGGWTGAIGQPARG